MRDLEAQAKALAPIIRDYVEKAVDAARKQMADDFNSVISVAAYDACVKAIGDLPMPNNGKDGESVTVEDVKPLIDDAVIKAISEIEIVAPEDGKPGRDALEIDLLPRIDEGKIYHRGTWATHNGGVWRAHATTEGMRGWECVVDGVSSHDCEQVDERNYEAVSRMASGKEFRKKMYLPNTIYRKIYKDGEMYQKGDLVTWAGCMWHCDEDTDTKPGDGAKHWTLSTKKGRDGKSS